MKWCCWGLLWRSSLLVCTKFFTINFGQQIAVHLLFQLFFVIGCIGFRFRFYQGDGIPSDGRRRARNRILLFFWAFWWRFIKLWPRRLPIVLSHLRRWWRSNLTYRRTLVVVIAICILGLDSLIIIIVLVGFVVIVGWAPVGVEPEGDSAFNQLFWYEYPHVEFKNKTRKSIKSVTHLWIVVWALFQVLIIFIITRAYFTSMPISSRKYPEEEEDFGDEDYQFYYFELLIQFLCFFNLFLLLLEALLVALLLLLIFFFQSFELKGSQLHN